MCQIAYAEGTRLISATAHQNDHWPDVTPDRILTATRELATSLREANISLAVFPCAEVMAFPEMETAWELPYDTGLNPIAMENNPDGSGRRIFINLGSENAFSVVDFATRKELTRGNSRRIKKNLCPEYDEHHNRSGGAHPFHLVRRSQETPDTSPYPD